MTADQGLAPGNPGVIAGLHEMAGSRNPLRDPRDRRIPRVAGPCVLVMFGVTGDLARKKLMPAVYDLAKLGIEYDDVVHVLELEGVDKFKASWNELLDTIKTNMGL